MDMDLAERSGRIEKLKKILQFSYYLRRFLREEKIYDGCCQLCKMSCAIYFLPLFSAGERGENTTALLSTV